MPTLAEEFAAFWATYPRRVSKPNAMKAYQKARIQATAEEIMAGVRVYLRHLPEETRYVPYAASWLNAERWTDEYDEPVVRQIEQCPHTPECHNKSWCLVVKARERGEVA
jgi:hypothetical protein